MECLFRAILIRVVFTSSDRSSFFFCCCFFALYVGCTHGVKEITLGVGGPAKFMDLIT